MNRLLAEIAEKKGIFAGVTSIAFYHFALCTKRLSKPNLEQFFLAMAYSHEVRAKNSFKHAVPAPGLKEALTLIDAALQNEVKEMYPKYISMAGKKGDRGVLRALTWSSKATMVLQSILKRLGKQKLEEQDYSTEKPWVCEACGFVSVKKDAPERCPVCYAPRHKFMAC